MKKMRVSTLLISMSVVFAVMAAAVAESELQHQLQDIKAQEKSVTVVVAKVDIPAHTVISPAMLQAESIPAGGMSHGAVVQMDSVVGKVTTQELFSGEQILPGFVTDKMTSADFADRIPTGDVAISVLYNPVLAVDGKIKAGNHVAVISVLNKGYNRTKEDVAQIIAQNVLVLSVPSVTSTANGTNQSSSRAVNLAVTPQVAKMIAFTAVYGQIYLTLQANEGHLPGLTSAVTDSTIG